MNDLKEGLRSAVRHFWATRDLQENSQGRKEGRRDRGSRAAVTGGAQMDGFASLIRDELVRNGVPESAVHRRKGVELPGYYRAEKKWDLLVVLDGRLLAGIEFKSHIGPSFGNNFNNRAEEALGNATDLWTAYREGAMQASPRPWLGYLMLLEDSPSSTVPVKTREPHFAVFPEFREASYVRRYEILLTKLLRERLYDSACLITSPRAEPAECTYREPCDDLSFQKFVTSLVGSALGAMRAG